MSWREKLQPASFRGVAFHVEDSSGTFGRRNHVHEYPGQDKPYVEDLGRRTREFSIEAFVVGADYMARRDALIEAIERGGEGTLIHPRFGALRVSATDNCRWSESTREGGMTKFSLAFVESGERQFPATAANSVSEVEAAVNTGLTAVQTDFNNTFAITDLPGWVADASQVLLDAGFDVLDPFVKTANTASNLTRTFDSVRSNTGTLMATPGNLASQTIDALRELFNVQEDTTTPITVRNNLAESFAAQSAVNATTPSRQQQADNQQAISDLFNVSATLLAAQSIVQQSDATAVASNADSPFDSYDDAVDVRDELLGYLDEVNTGSDELYNAIRATQVALVRHIKQHGYRLERIKTITPAAQLPALVLAHNLYGDAERDADIVRRNKIRHPGFVAGGTALEVLNA